MHPFLLKILLFILVIQVFPARCCVEHEREALLKFKAGVNDSSNRLVSWTGDECCNWAGVTCSNQTGHIITLDLRNSYFYNFSWDGVIYPEYEWNNHSLTGKISPSLQHISELQYLDLSYNNFSGNEFPSFINSFRNLNYLNFSTTGLSGILLPHLGNLSKLQYLDLSRTNLSGIIPPQLDNLSKLQYLVLSRTGLSGIIPPQLGNLSKLQHLVLSGTGLSGIIPPQLGNLSKLQHLVLSGTGLSGIIPPQLGNLSKLQYLELSYNPNIYISNVWVLSHLTSLTYLNMVSVNFQDSREWTQALNTLPLLESLYLGENNLTTIPTSITGLNFTSLKTFSIHENEFNSRIADWIGKLTTLTRLELWSCSFVGQIPSQLDNLTSLNTLYLGEDYLEGPMPQLHNLKNLTKLDIWDVNIGEDIRVVVNKLASDTLDKLEFLYLENVSLTGNLNGWMSKMPNLKELILSHNNLNGPLPTVIGNLTSLEYLSLNNNNFTGEVSEAHVIGLSNLKQLDLSSNNLNLTVNMSWVPPFRLNYLSLSGCKLGPYFPLWLQNQSQMSDIELSNTGIVEAVPHWFWNSQSLYYIDLSYNHMKGRLPLNLEHLTNLIVLLLHNNLFEGGIPYLSQSIIYVDLSDNLFSGNIPHGLPNSLIVMNMAHNNLYGAIPSSIGNLNLLEALQLNNNNLTGELPSELQFCQNLTVLDLGENKFEGIIPKWMGENLRNLTILRLRSNLFFGTIPIQLIKLRYLQILDLANNKFFGMIPQNMDFLLSMTFRDGNNNNNSAYNDFVRLGQYDYNISVSIIMKDQDLIFTTSLSSVKSIDLSGNNLTGMIPKNITVLHGLISLNLSNNHLIGPIPPEIGKMNSLESLDLRNNELSGIIPQSLTNLNFLATLNLSYNNLSGKIPTGNQLQTLDDSYIYVGNNYLCGPPTRKSCDSSNVQNSTGHTRKFGEDLSKILLYLFIIFGFGCGLWVVLWIFLFKITWRYIFFHTVDCWFDSIYKYMVLYLGRVRK
ncbi:Receptor-like protein kinase HAIKU2 [Rhynchospora pubera]|uniref:Receptor-like protein kinase HAIKU2 n=1 Tax=Rhynchospora pubera TaxID=906938 RepID=A0AAV8F7M3_9POAL|nr:Receptor-like protein kinase HAIKU2 [Rhynchospora pubera]KAJ4809201.1 Receptor-like protein kinase HAIKU2 [Rhynchospora pubera]